MSERSGTKLWAIITSAYFSILPLVVYLVSTDSPLDRPIQGFPHRAIGRVGFRGIDGTARVHDYVLFVFLTIAVFLCTVFFLTWILQVARKHNISVRIRPEKETIYNLVLIQIMGTIKLAISNDPIAGKIVAALFFSFRCLSQLRY